MLSAKLKLNPECRSAFARFFVQQENIEENLPVFKTIDDEDVSVQRNSQVFRMMLFSRNYTSALQAAFNNATLTFLPDDDYCTLEFGKNDSTKLEMPITHAIALMSTIGVPSSFRFAIQRRVNYNNKLRLLRPDLYLKLLEKCQGTKEFVINGRFTTDDISSYYVLAMQKLGFKLSSLTGPYQLLNLETGISRMKLDEFKCTNSLPSGEMFRYVLQHNIKHLDFKKVDLMALKETLFFQVASESLKDEVLLNAMQTIEKLSVTVTYQNRKELIELIKTIKSMMPNVKILNVDVKVYEHISHPNISNKLTRLIGSVLDFASQLGFNETYVNCTGELEFVDLGTRQLTVPQIWNSVIQTSFKEMKSTTTSTCLMNSRGDIICNGEYLTAEMESSNYKMKTELSVLHDSADDNSDDDFDLNYDDN